MSSKGISLRLHAIAGTAGTLAMLAAMSDFFTIAPAEAHEPIASLRSVGPFFSFDGQNQEINLGNSAPVKVSKSDFTVEVKVLFRDLENNDGPCFGPSCDMSIIDKMAVVPDCFNCDGWRLVKQSNNRIYFCFGAANKGNGCDLGNPNTVASSSIVSENKWYHIFATKLGKKLTIYINGVLEGISYASKVVDTNRANMLIGANAKEGAHLNGIIKEVNLYSNSLSIKKIWLLSTK